MYKNKFLQFLVALFVGVVFVAFTTNDKATTVHMPYKKNGFTQQQAAQYLLNKFTFGAKPCEAEQVVNMGLDKWFTKQLAANFEEDSLVEKLASLDAINKTTLEIANTYPNPGTLANLARKKYELNRKDSTQDRKDYREEIREIMLKEGFKPVVDLNRQLVYQKIYRAAYSNNQLHEVLTDFWFNHFNVSLTKNQCVQYVLPYERDAIRPFVAGNFFDMLLATAKHPAMLEYLDNASSVSQNNAAAEKQMNSAFAKQVQQDMQQKAADSLNPNAKLLQRLVNNKKTQGLNENFAREVMELHTLGVDGGYTQTDVTQLAKILTGWSVFPLNKYAPGKELVERFGVDKMKQRGYIVEEGFLYKPDKHDDKAKTFLGQNFEAGGGYEEGVKALQLLANHAATAKFIATKLAIRFVSDEPSAVLINEMANAFSNSKGNIKTVLIAMINSNEFWNNAKRNEKVKSPFELAISSIRTTNATITDAFQLNNWITKMGQRIYYYQAPTGFPDRANYWINTGALLNRMNFGLAFATNKIPGVKANLPALNFNREPESVEDALMVYSKILLPEKDNNKNIARLTKLIGTENFAEKINQAAEKNAPVNTMNTTDDDMMAGAEKVKQKKLEKQALGKKSNPMVSVNYAQGNNTMIAQVVGVIIGSPEFQKKS